MNREYEQKWKRTVEWLRLQFPAAYPVAVRRLDLAKAKIDGDCSFNDARFRIRIEKNQVFSPMMDALIHEWAHAISWLGPPGIEDHSSEWGVAYARIYSAFEKWNYGKGNK